MANMTLNKVWKVYDRDNVAVRNVDLNIVDGEFMVLVGPSGCGKSTTLRMIAGLEDISSGTVAIDDRVVNNVAPRDRDIAMVFQSYALYPHMTVADNMTFALRIRRAAADFVKSRLAMATDILGLGGYLARKPKALSGGQRQRVAMGRAIVREPKVFLFDEPLSNLDAKMRVEMRREIIRLHRQVAATMIYVTHDQVEAMTLGDRICVMEKGVVRQVGTPGEVFDNPQNIFVAGFIGTPPMNLLEGVIRQSEGKTVFDGGGIKAALPPGIAARAASLMGKKAILGIRPKSFVPAENENGEYPDTGQVWEVIPEIAEMLGEEALVHMRAGDNRFIVNMDPQCIPPLDTLFAIRPLMNRAHIFDPVTGINLTLGLELPGRQSIRRFK